MHKSPINTDDFIRTSTAARILGVSSETARGWANTGRLHVTKTLDGMRLFSLFGVRTAAPGVRRALSPGQPHHAQLVAQLLVLLDGLDARGQIVVLATTKAGIMRY